MLLDNLWEHRSATSRPAMILGRETTPAWRLRLCLVTSCNPVDADAHAEVVLLGFEGRSLAPS